jgi:beta-barrel assembly-enhancing protease
MNLKAALAAFFIYLFLILINNNLLMNSGTPKVLAVLVSIMLFFVLLGWLLYVWVVPFSMSVLIGFFPKEWEIELGKEFKKSFLSTEKIDSTNTELINKFYSHIKNDTEYPIYITVVDKDIKNAFALPGGEIVVYSKIIDDMKSYKELVALLSHETAHVQYRHSLQTLGNNLANYLIISTIFGDLTGVSAIIIDNAASLKQLSYSRTLESEADMYAYNLMRKNHVDTDGLLDLFNNLRKQSTDELQNDSNTPEFLLTHPKLDSRMDDIRQRIENDSPISFKTNDSLAFYFVKLK